MPLGIVLTSWSWTYGRLAIKRGRYTRYTPGSHHPCMEKQPKRGELGTKRTVEKYKDCMNPHVNLMRWEVPTQEVNVKVGRVPKGERATQMATGRRLDRLEDWWLEYVGILGTMTKSMVLWFPFLEPMNNSRKHETVYVSLRLRRRHSNPQVDASDAADAAVNWVECDWLTPCLWKHSKLSLLTRSTSKKVDIRGCEICEMSGGAKIYQLCPHSICMQVCIKLDTIVGISMESMCCRVDFRKKGVALHHSSHELTNPRFPHAKHAERAGCMLLAKSWLNALNA